MIESKATKPVGNAFARIVDEQWKSAAIGSDTVIHTVIADAPDLTSLCNAVKRPSERSEISTACSYRKTNQSSCSSPRRRE